MVLGGCTSRCCSVTLEGKQLSTVFLHSRAASLPHPPRKIKSTLLGAVSIGADYVSSQKQLSVVFGVANAIKQEVIGVRLVLASSTTMF